MEAEAVDHEGEVRDALLAVARCAREQAARLADVAPFIAGHLETLAENLTLEDGTSSG